MDGEVKLEKRYVGNAFIRSKFTEGKGCEDCTYRLVDLTSKKGCPHFIIKLDGKRKRRVRCFGFLKIGENLKKTRLFIERNSTTYGGTNRLYCGKKPSIAGIKRIEARYLRQIDNNDNFGQPYAWGHRRIKKTKVDKDGIWQPGKIIPIRIIERLRS